MADVIFPPLTQVGPYAQRVVALPDLATAAPTGEAAVVQLAPMAGCNFNYNLIDEMVKTIVTGVGTVSQANSLATVASGAAINSTAAMFTRLFLRAVPTSGGIVQLSAYFPTAGTAGNTRVAGLGTSTAGYFFGFNGTSFGICFRSGGVDNWVAQTAWNTDTATWLDPTKGNLYAIDLQGVWGEVQFSVMDPATGLWVVVHRVNSLNAVTTLGVNNTLPVRFSSNNDGTCSTSCLIVVASAMAFSPNITSYDHNPMSISRNLSVSSAVTGGVSTTLLLLENQTTLNSVTNLVPLDFGALSLGADGTQPASFRITRSPTLGGTAPVYSNVLVNQSPVRYSSTAGITFTGGTTVFSTFLNKTDRVTLDLNEWALILTPGESLVFSVFSSGNTTATVSTQWLEGF